MEAIGVRELRQNASKYLHRVAAGESFAITEHGRPVAVLNPPPVALSVYDELIASGELIAAERPYGEFSLSEPLSAASGPSGSEELQRMRDEERF